MSNRLKVLLLAVLVSSLASSLFLGGAFAQGGATGAISGTVLDSSGGVIPSAQVQIRDERTGNLVRTLQTGTNGIFVASLLPPATYTVVVTAKGFGEQRATGIEVRVTETTTANITLKPSQVTQQVTVSAEVITVNTENPATGQDINTNTVRSLPLATQNFQQLLTLSTGAQSDLNASAQLGRGNVRILVNGQREDNNNYLIDGISATDYNVAQATNTPLPSPDVIQEFKVQTSLYDASQGRNGGGNVNAILKSGSKEFHGDLYEFFRNDVLNANEFFLNSAGRPRPPVKQNIFGGSLGGPVAREGKAGFFFLNYQGTRQRSGLSPGTTINNPGFPILPPGPIGRSQQSLSQVFFGNTTTSIDPVVLALLNFKGNQFGSDANGFLIPSLPGTPGTVTPFILSRPGKFTDDQFTANWDREFRGSRDKVAARFFFSDSESFLPFGAGGLQASLGGTLSTSISATDLNFPFDLPLRTRFLSLTETHVFSAALLNEIRFGFVQINDDLKNVNPVTAADLGIDRPTNNVTKSVYKFTLGSSGFQIGPAPFADQSQTQNKFSFADTLGWVKGSHAIRFGGEYTRVSLDKLFPQVFNGQLFFVNGGGLTDFQKFLLGAPDFSFGGGGVFNHEYRLNDYAAFAQDDWKVRRDLTLNLGVRTEVFGGFYDNKCHIGNLDPALAKKGEFPFLYPKCVNGLKVAGLTGNANNTTYDNNYSTGLGPRIGFAYDLFGHHTTTIRTGYGIYYVREDVGSVDQLSFQTPFLPVAFGGGPPGCMATFFSASPLPGCPNPNPNALPPGGVIDPTFVPCLSVFQGFPASGTTQAPNYACNGPGLQSINIFGLQVPRHFVVPNTQQWNLTTERVLWKQWVLEVGYVGTHAIHLRETRDNLQAQRATPANPVVIPGVNCDGTTGPGAQCLITQNTFANAPARSRAQGINGYAGFQLFADDAYSHYHSLQVTLSHRWAANYFQGAYTFSKSTDATSSGNTAFNTAFNDESTLNASRGLSDFDRKQRLAVSYLYNVPFYKSSTGVMGAFLRGWALSGITIFQSGTPFSINDSSAGTAFLVAGFTPLTLTASLAPGATLSSGLTSGDIHQRINGYLNPAAFTPAPLLYPTQCASDPNFCVTDFGNLGRNIYRGPFEQNWDFSLIKNFQLTERQTIRFTTEFFNLWNHANFANPAGTDVENPATFGKITQTVGTPRLIQFSLRWAF